MHERLLWMSVCRPLGDTQVPWERSARSITQLHSLWAMCDISNCKLISISLNVWRLISMTVVFSPSWLRHGRMESPNLSVFSNVT